MSLPTVHVCGRQLDRARHVCAFVSSREEQYGILAPYVKEGLEHGDQVLQIIDASQRADHLARQRRGGVPIDAAIARNQLAISGWDDAYLKDGFFDAERMLATIQSAQAERRANGFPMLRAHGDMAWALKGAPGTEQLLEYECRVNDVVKMQPEDTFLCFYDITRFPADTVVDVLRTHPAVIIGGVYHENPFFLPPSQMLAELVARGKAKRVEAAA